MSKFPGKSFSKWIEVIRDIGSRATKGEWWLDSHGHALHAPNECEILVVFKAETKAVRHKDTGNLSSWRNDNDADWIPTANPDKVNHLVERFISLNKAYADLAGIDLSKDGDYTITTIDGEVTVTVSEGYLYFPSE